MRLIDADALIEELYKNTKIGHYGEFTDGSEVAYTYNEISKAIEEQPTAFDTEKVVKKLEEKTDFLKDCTKYGNKDAEQQEKSYSTMMMYEIADLVEDLIDIVKKGGVE